MILRGTIGVARLELGDLDGALAHLLTALREASRIGPQTEAAAAVYLGYAYLQRGDLSAVRRLLGQYAAALDAVDARTAADQWGRLLAEEGAPAQALARYQEGAGYEDDPASAWCLTGAARTAVAVGELTVAREALAGLERLADRWPVGEWLRDEARGWVAVGEDRPADAAAAFRTAAAGCSERYGATRLALEAARLVGDRDQVRAAIDEFEHNPHETWRGPFSSTRDQARTAEREVPPFAHGRSAAAAGVTAARKRKQVRPPLSAASVRIVEPRREQDPLDLHAV